MTPNKKRITREDLAIEVSKVTGYSRSETSRTVEVVVKMMGKLISEGNKLTLAGFGTFDSVYRKAHNGRDFKNKTTLKVKAHYKVKYAPAEVIVKKLKSVEA